MSSGKMRTVLPLCIVSLFLTSWAVADVKETEEFTFDINPGGRISLENINGDIRITGDDGDTVMRGGATDMVFTRSGWASSSASVIQRADTGVSASINPFSASVRATLSSDVSGRSKSSRLFSTPTWPPVTDPSISADSRWSAVCMRISTWRRCQSIAMVTAVPTARLGAPSAGT